MVLADFMQIDGVKDLQARCRAWQAERFAQLMQEPDGLKLYGRLLLAGGSTHLPKAAALDLVKAYRNLPTHG